MINFTYKIHIIFIPHAIKCENVSMQVYSLGHRKIRIYTTEKVKKGAQKSPFELERHTVMVVSVYVSETDKSI